MSLLLQDKQYRLSDCDHKDELYNTFVMRKLNFLLVLFLVFCPILSNVWAQKSLEDEKPLDKVAKVKAEIMSLLDENRKLQSEYDNLNQQLNALLKTQNQHKQAMWNIQADAQKVIQSEEQERKSLENLRMSIDEMKNEILLKQSKESFLRGELIDTEEKLRLWRLQLADLQYQKRDLEMEWKMKDFKGQEFARKQNDEMNRLKDEIIATIEEEKELARQMDELEHQSRNDAVVIERLTKENKDFDDQIQKLEKENSFKVRENGNLSDRRLLAEKSFELVLDQKKAQREQLAEIVRSLESEYQDLDTRVQKSLSYQDQKRKLTENIINLDKENQGLRQKIETLRKAIGPQR